jgi:exopolyphosphatase/guanosine-5'-triphosphate,3'-diphosphate pyrophosphatase
MSAKATIDIGSNSILLLIAKKVNNSLDVLENHSFVTGLGKDLDLTENFLEESMSDSFEVLKKYTEIIKSYNIRFEDVIVTATEASRVAKNAKTFYQKVKQELGLNVQVITGEAEAHFSTMGILFDKKISDKEIVIMDIGGASTELIKVNTAEKKIINSFSMPIGAVRFNNWKIDGCYLENLDKVLRDYADRLTSMKTNKLFCVAGTMTSVGNMYLGESDFKEKEVNGLQFDMKSFLELKNRLKEYSAEDYLKEFPFLGKRSKTIQSGMDLAYTIFKKLDVEEVYISTYGLRYGTLLEGEIQDEFIYR